MSDEAQKTDAQPEEQAAPEAAPAEAPAEAPAQEEAGEEVEVPAEFKALVEQIEKMTVLELNSLVKVLEKKFGVSAVAVAAAPAGGAADAGADEKSEYTVELESAGESKIAVIKIVKEVSGLGLKEAKDLVDGAPGVIKEGVKKEDAEDMKKKIEEVGGKVNLK